jgi:peptide/nickel transport system permease protein
MTRPIAAAALAALFLGCLALAPAGGGVTAGPALSPPFLPPGAPGHPLGTDDLGRDVLALVARGGRGALAVAGLAVPLALLVGLATGIAAGLARAPLAEAALMRAADLVACLPVLLLAVLLTAAAGPDPLALGLLLGLTRWPLVARLVRAEVAALRDREFVRAARALGVGPWRLAWRHLLPQAARPALASAGVLFGWAIVTESALGFVGLGDPSGASWGQLIAAGFGFLDRAPWMWLAPAGALAAGAMLAGLAAEAGTAGAPGRDARRVPYGGSRSGGLT